MNEMVVIEAASLPSIVRRAADQLASATNAAEILEARDLASFAYDASKKAARLARAKGAHDEIIAKAHRAQADALLIESEAKRRLADEYDAAQERGEVRRPNNEKTTSGVEAVSVSDIGLTHKDIHEARIIRDAERNEPGIAERALNARLAQGLEPNKAALREAVNEAARQGYRGASAPSNRNPSYVAPTRAGAAWSRIYGTSREFVEWATDENIALALQGIRERRDDQAANIRAVHRAVAVFNEIAEKLNAH